MNNMNVILLPASEQYTPEQALGHAMIRGLTDVLICGYDEDHDLVVLSSKMTRAEGLYMTEKAKEWCMHGGLE